MMAVYRFNPSVTLPPHNHIAKSALRAIVLQRTKVIARERRRQLVEHRMVGTIALTLVAGIDILVLQRLAKGLHLLAKAVFGHHPREVETGLTLLVLPREQMEHHSTTEPDDRRTLAIDVLHVVDVFGGLHALLFHPCLDGLAKSGRIHETAMRAETGDGLLYPCLVLFRATCELRHLRER